MIPKIIHYCWFGRNPLPKSAVKCIESWRKFFPDYEIKEWNEDNFDVNIIPYTAEAYKAKKYAYVSDYARFWILYQYGGIYFDTDVEVIRPMDDIIAAGNFMGMERDSNCGTTGTVAPGLGLGVNPGLGLIKEMLDMYETLDYETENKGNIYKTIVQYTTEKLESHGLKDIGGIQYVADVFVYPKEYFNPLEHINQLHITENTRTIHHYDGTWQPWWAKTYRKVIRLLGSQNYGYLLKLRNIVRGSHK